MPEDSFLRCEREYFVSIENDKFEISKKVLNELLRKYNMFLQKALIGESPFIAEDLKLTILRSGGSSGKEDK